MAEALPARELPPLQSSAFTGPLVVLVNVASGSHADDEPTDEAVRRLLVESGRSHQVLTLDRPDRLKPLARQAVDTALELGGGVVAVGGDGTLNALAQAALPHRCPFGAVPHGTFNMFGRSQGLPLDLQEAVRGLLDATIEPVQVGMVNDRVFLVNASVGLYPELLEDREAWKRQFGRNKLVALCAGLLTVLREHRRLALGLQDDSGTFRRIRTWTLFVGNNPMQLERLGIQEGPVAGRGKLVGVVVKPVGLMATLGLLLRSALGQLGDADNVSSFAFEQMTVMPAMRYGRRRLKVAIDGEILWLPTPLQFRTSPVPLQLLRPAPRPADDART